LIAAARLVLISTLTAVFGLASVVPAAAASPPAPAVKVRHQAHIPSGVRPGRPFVPGARPALSPAGPSGGYIPCDLWGAYHLPQPGSASPNGAGKLIAIIDPFDVGNPGSDLGAFDATLGVPDPPGGLQTPLNTTGWTPNTLSPPTWATEIAIDTQWAHAMAPGASLALVYAKTGLPDDILAAIDYAVNTLSADVISMSWTFTEGTDLMAQDVTTFEAHFPPTNGAGRSITYLAATGDSPANPPSWPADSARVVGVGATSVGLPGFGGQTTVSHTTCTLPPSGVEADTEQRWASSQAGDSTVVGRPPYQSGGANARHMPDVAMVGDPNEGVAVYENGGWDPTLQGGTSLSTALWAGVVARLDQSRQGARMPNLRVTARQAWPYDLAALDSTSFNESCAGASNVGLCSPLFNKMVQTATTEPPYVGYFSYYDALSPGVRGDNIHVVNPNSTDVSVSIRLAGSVVYGPVTVHPGQEVFASLGVRAGGPIEIDASKRVIASQRVQYNASFNEIPAMPRDLASYSLNFTWYDRISDIGFQSDNLHVFNPSASDTATVNVSIPGHPPCNTVGATIGPGRFQVFNCATGFGGPAVVTSNVPLLGSQRVQYYSTFNEANAMGDLNGAATQDFTWYDRLSSSGFKNDNVHVMNPGPNAASVSITIPGQPSCAYANITVNPGQEAFRGCATGFQGPVIITADQRVFASQRVQYYQSFNEVGSMPTGQAAKTLYGPWYDIISDPGFQNDNVHVMNPSTTATAHVNVTILHPDGSPCSIPTLTVPPGGELFTGCPVGYGGPVTVSSDQPVIASQRVQYYQTFNEAALSG
jgi:hypothetical protein